MTLRTLAPLQNLSWIFWSVSVLLLWGYLQPPLFSSLRSPTSFFVCVGWMPLHSLLFTLFMAEFSSTLYKYSLSMCQQHDVSAKNNWHWWSSSQFANNIPIHYLKWVSHHLWEVNQGSIYGPIFYRQENWGWGRSNITHLVKSFAKIGMEFLNSEIYTELLQSQDALQGV